MGRCVKECCNLWKNKAVVQVNMGTDAEIENRETTWTYVI